MKQPKKKNTLLEGLNLEPQKPETKIQEVMNDNSKKTNSDKTKGDRKIIPVFTALGIELKKFEKDSKRTTYLSDSTHKKLSELSKLTGENIMDIADSIISNVLEKNKDVIKKEIQKNTKSIWD